MRKIDVKEFGFAFFLNLLSLWFFVDIFISQIVTSFGLQNEGKGLKVCRALIVTKATKTPEG